MEVVKQEIGIILNDEYSKKLLDIECATGIDGPDRTLEAIIDFYIDVKKSMMIHNVM